MTPMYPLGQVFPYDGTTPATLLGRVVGYNSFKLPTGTLSLVRDHRKEIAPACISNAFCQVVVFQYVLDFEVFRHNFAVPVLPDKLTGYLVQVVMR